MYLNVGYSHKYMHTFIEATNMDYISTGNGEIIWLDAINIIKYVGRPIQYTWATSLPCDYNRTIWKGFLSLLTTIMGYLKTLIVEWTDQQHKKWYWRLY